MGSALINSILESIFRIVETGPETKVGVSNQLIDVGALIPLEAESKGHHDKKCEASPKKVEFSHRA